MCSQPNAGMMGIYVRTYICVDGGHTIRMYHTCVSTIGIHHMYSTYHMNVQDVHVLA